MHDLIACRSEHLDDPLSDASDILRFLIRCFPEGITAPEFLEGETPYAMLDPKLSYARRLLLMCAARHDPTIDLDGAELRRLNYEARKTALFAFFVPTSERNIFTKIRCVSDGALMRLIVRFL